MCPRKDIHDGWCPNINRAHLSALQRPGKAGEDALAVAEPILAWFRTACAEALDTLEHSLRVKLLGNLDVSIGETLMQRQTEGRVPKLFREAQRIRAKLEKRCPGFTPAAPTAWAISGEAVAEGADEEGERPRLRANGGSTAPSPKMILYDENFKNMSEQDSFAPRKEQRQEWRFAEVMHRRLHGREKEDVLDEARHAVWYLLRRPPRPSFCTPDKTDTHAHTHTHTHTHTHAHTRTQNTHSTLR